MSEKDRPSRAEKLGERFGRCWKCYLHALNKIEHYLQRWGIPFALSRLVGWALYAVVIIGLLYVAFWVTLVAITLFVTWKVRTTDDDAGWRHGHEGYGYYQNGIRTDFARLFEEDE